MSGSAQRQNDISARRIAQADQAGKRKGGPKADTFGSGEHLLHMPGKSRREAGEAGRDALLHAAEARSAAAYVADLALRHGCGGAPDEGTGDPGCPAPGHAGHAARIREHLGALFAAGEIPAGRARDFTAKAAAFNDIQPGGTH